MSIIVLGGVTGYVGSAIFTAMQKRGIAGIAVSRKQVDYTKREELVTLLEAAKPSFVINAAAWIPQPSVDLCKNDRAKCLRANVILPDMISTECNKRGIAIGHISTGCLYGDDREYTETDEPTRRVTDYAGTYVWLKYTSEMIVRELCPRSFVWRIRIPFDNQDSPRNYLTKLRQYPQIWNHTNSLTHRGDFADSALLMIEKGAPWGVYNMTNRGSIATVTIVNSAGWTGKTYVDGPVTGSRLSTAKLEATGCGMRDVWDAVEESLRTWVA